MRVLDRAGFSSMWRVGLLAVWMVSCQPSEDSEPSGSASAVQETLVTPLEDPRICRQLQPGVSSQEQLSPSEVHCYTLDLTADQFIYLEVEQLGVDITATLFAPDASMLVKVDRDIGYDGREPLLAVAETEGKHTLEVKASDYPWVAGSYQIEVRAWQVASPTDRLRAKAAALVYDKKDLQQALDLWRTVEDDFWQAETLYLLAKYEADAEQAVRLYERSAALFAEVGDAQRQGTALNSAGNLRRKAGEAEEAIRYYQRALAAQADPGNRVGKAIAKSNLGRAHRSLGRYNEALAQYGEALKLWDEDKDSDRIAQTSHNLGVVYRLLGSFELAADYLKTAEGAFGDLGRDKLGPEKRQLDRRRAATLNQLGKLYYQENDPRKALDFHRQALALRAQHEDRRGEANSWVDIGLAHRALDGPDAARQAYDRALDILEDLDRPRVEAKVLLASSSLIGAPEQEALASDNLQQSASLYRGFGDPVGEAESLISLAASYSRQGQVGLAQQAAGKAADLVEDLRLNAVSPEFRSSYFSTVEHFFDLQIDLLMTSHQQEPNAGYAAQALRVNERARARSLLEMLAETGVDIRRGVAPELLERERTLQEAVNGNAQRLRLLKSASQHRTPRIEAAEKQQREAVAQLGALRSEIRTRSPRYAALTQPKPLGLEEIQRLLVDDSTLLLQFQLAEERSHLWLVGHDSLEVFELPARHRLESLASKTAELLKHSNRPESLVSSRRFLCELSQHLLGQVAERLTAERLVIVADGALQFVPFAVLPSPSVSAGCAEAPPLVVDHEIVYLPSASVLGVLRQETAARPPAPGLLAVLADPVFSPLDERIRSNDSAPSSHVSTAPQPLRRLEHSRAEADGILALVPAERRFSAFDVAASKNVVIEGDLDAYRIIHFATHAVLDTKQPELSGLVFSHVDANGRPQSDPFLRLHELYNLDLAAELVVLSACNTALGKEVRGEGLVGLTRGFMYAGARRVMVSLWSVGDDSTRELMIQFYQGLLEDTLAPAAALRQAQIAMWKEGRSPFHWGAFILEGEWNPLPPWEE